MYLTVPNIQGDLNVLRKNGMSQTWTKVMFVMNPGYFGRCEFN